MIDRRRRDGEKRREKVKSKLLFILMLTTGNQRAMPKIPGIDGFFFFAYVNVSMLNYSELMAQW